MANSCHVIQSLIFMMLSHMVEVHWWKTSAVRYIVRFRDQRLNVKILYSKGKSIKSIYIKMFIRNVTSLRSYFYELWMLGRGLSSIKCQCKHNYPTRKERLLLDKYSMLNIGIFFIWKFLHWRTIWDQAMNTIFRLNVIDPLR